MVAVLVMPLAAVHEVSDRWLLGATVCDLFVYMDVLCCTSSILHLVAISLDRYWAVKCLDYVRNRPVKRIMWLVAISWIFSAVISSPRLFGLKDDDNAHYAALCAISQNIGYTVFSTVGAFYLPLVVMIIIYLSIYRAAKSRIRKKAFSDKNKHKYDRPEENCGKKIFTEKYFKANSLSKFENRNPYEGGSEDDSSFVFLTQHSPKPRKTAEERAKEKRETKRERKAARTLAIITSSFVICWLPFFTIALLKPFSTQVRSTPPLIISLASWLGYLNSLLNPIIYTVFNPDFRFYDENSSIFGQFKKKLSNNDFCIFSI
ncbi:hypothetical protein HELRODRAFT_104849 [Helobdella robusta]|uniref:G-protein coupled receptors family 1 profile domain-containing protein n=1 Tax=Helobdella robusta TaxID=6412 RepID=T1EDN8_HELRO|nr:hypothetical protein HELRODRAFT_104849 [Helobdella robusta]ESO10344.1 hypothetical protein HELRODRAFT_104849 [Helobdella robusta]